MQLSIRKIKLAILALVFSLSIKAQDDTVRTWRCGMDSTLFSILNSDTAFVDSMQSYNASILSRTTNTLSTGPYIVPVVFHIIATNTSTLTYAQIKWQVAALNAAYQNQVFQFTGRSAGLYTAFTNIEFRLACVATPSTGTNPITGAAAGWTNINEPGVVRYAITNTVVLNQGVLTPSTFNPMLNMTNPAGYFPKANYLNIYCVPNILPSGVIGFATFPSMTYALDGIVMRIDAIGNNTYPTNFPMLSQLNKGFVLAHEAGHYLGLFHTFETAIGGNLTSNAVGCYGTSGVYNTTTTAAYTDGDMIYDTPPTSVSSDLGGLTTINTCYETYSPYQGGYAVAGPQNDQLENYMCYSDDDKINTFTQLQAKRMWGAFDSNYGPALRSVLTSTANLVATGVGTGVNSNCAAQTGIVTGIFNYAIANGNCSSINVQFTNPTSLGFSTPSITTYSWTFGDGGTSTSANPLHTYNTQTVYPVVCTATNGSVTNTYSTTISTNFNVQIVGQSSQTGTLTTSTVCKGSEQTIFLQFGAGVPSVNITDGVGNTYTVSNYMSLANPQIIPYLFTANTTGTFTYNISPASCNGVSNGVAIFNVIDCCPTLITNGDFESTYTTTPTYGFATDLFYTNAGVFVGGIQQFGDYDVNSLGSGYFGTLAQFSPTAVHNATGKVMQVDGFSGNNTIVNTPPACSTTPSPAPRVWQQVVTGLQRNTTYFYSFKILENFDDVSMGCPGQLNFRTSIASNSTTLLPAQTFTPNIDNTITPTVLDWIVYTYTFTTPSSTTPSNTYSVTINQINDFQGGYYDFLMDNITLNAMIPGIQASGSATVCPTATVQLTAVTNCANVANYTYQWIPSTALTCTNCANPVANPSTTTVYTLVASPTSTLGIYPTYVSTVTVTINPTPVISVTGNTTVCPGMSSTTLTATGANTYTWQPGGSSTNPIIFTPSVTTTYTVTGTGTGCTSTGTKTITVTVNSTATSIAVTPSSTTLCSYGTGVTLTASGASTYTWIPATTLNTSSSATVVASPPVSTTYTVMGTNNGCIGTNTVSITVTPIPSMSVTETYSTICTGQSSVFTVSGASSYVWTPAASLSSSTSATVTATPTTTTLYTVTGTSAGCTSYKLINLAVNPIPTLTVTPTSTTVCSGTPIALHASGATTYSWSPSSGLSATTGSVVIATPSVTTTYSVTGSTNNCTSPNKTVTITVDPQITINPLNTSVCSGLPVNLTTTGATNYTWSPGSTLSCTNCANPVATPTANTTYTVTGSYGASCVSTATVAFTVSTYSTCTGTSPGTYTVNSSTIYTVSPAVINQNLYIGNGTSTPNFTINCANISIAPNLSITVASGATLTISGSWLHACGTCNGAMWQGIIVQNGGTLIVNNYSIIEDAVVAVKTATTGTTSTVPAWQISSSIFNKNSTDIYIDNHVGNLSTNYIYNTIFTCRNLNSHSVTSGTYTAIKTDIAASTPLIPSTTNPTTVTLGGIRTQYDVYLNKATYSLGINIGDKAQSNNLFDYADNGIYSAATAITVKNNTFQNFTGNSNATNTMTIGVAINVITIDGQPLPKVVIGNSSTTVIAAEKNYFTNCLRGVMTNGCEKVYINNNTFYNESTANNFTVAGTHVIGEFGVIQTKFGFSSSTTILEGLQYANNLCQNYATAYSLDFRKVYNTASQSMYFLNNVINGAGTSTKYTNYGIYLAQSTTYGANTTTVPQDMISITTNSITNVNTSCISVNTVNTSTVSGFVTINANTELSLLYQNYSALQSPRVAAIGLYNSTYTKVSDNSIIKCTGLSTYPSTNSQNIAGIYTTNCPLSTVNCNSVTCVGEGFVFEGASPNSTWRSNQTNTGHYGLVLRTNGYMGNQGASGNSIRTIYGNYSTVNLVKGQTLCDNSDPNPVGATPAALYVSNLGLSCPNTTFYNELPCNNITNTTHFYSTSSSPLNLIITGNTGTSPCATSGGGGGTGGAGMVANGSSTSASDASSAPTSSDLQSLVATGAALQSYNTETRWANQYYVNSLDATIAAASGYSNAKAFALADVAFAAGKYSQAQSLVNSVSPINIIETNWKNVDNILLKQVTLPTYTLTNTDVTTLNNVAQQCPTTGGTIVYKARAILNSFYSNIIEYHYDCQPITISGNRLANNTGETEGIALENQTVNLYPNPNNGTMMLDYNVKADANLEISDLSGRLVGTYFLPAAGTHAEVKNNELNNGVYIYRVTSNGVVIKIGKIIVMQ